MAFHSSTAACSCPRRSIQTGGNLERSELAEGARLANFSIFFLRFVRRDVSCGFVVCYFMSGAAGSSATDGRPKSDAKLVEFLAFA